MKLLIMLLLPLQTFAADKISVGLLGLTYHGAGTENDLAAQADMKRKITPDGVVVWNPEINITIQKDSIIYNATVLSDCFGNPAYYVGVGKSWDLNTSGLSVGAMLGVYVRENDGVTNMPQWMRKGFYDVIPAPWLFIQKDFVMTETTSLMVQAASNYALTHVVTGFSFGF